MNHVPATWRVPEPGDTVSGSFTVVNVHYKPKRNGRMRPTFIELQHDCGHGFGVGARRVYMLQREGRKASCFACGAGVVSAPSCPSCGGVLLIVHGEEMCSRVSCPTRPPKPTPPKSRESITTAAI